MKTKAGLSVICVIMILASCQFVKTDAFKKEIIDLGLPVFLISTNDEIPYEEKIASKWDFRYKRMKSTGKGKIRRRGGLSASYEKRSYTLNTNQREFFGNLPSDTEWILNANFIDKTFMRHKFSYDLFREMNPENLATLCEYAQVFVNEKYMGLYVMMERLNEENLNLDVRDSMAVIFKDPPIFTTVERLSKYELKNDTRWFLNYPKKDSIRFNNEMDEFRSFLLKSDDQSFQNEISKKVKIENVIDWHLYLLLSNNADGLVKNFFLYRQKSGQAYNISIWDADHSFGRDGDGEKNMLKKTIQIENNILLKRLLEIPDYKNKLKNKYKILRKKIFTMNHFNEMLASNEASIKEALPYNSKIWPDNHKLYYDDNDFDAEVKLMKDFLVLRLEQLDEMFLREEDFLRERK